jgi:hypothetical protein
VSFWPWKGQDNSAASFEKTLSTLSTKIAQATARLDQQRQTSRRFKALWTLYSTFAYLFYSIVLALVLGWETWGVKEYAAIAGGPVLIYAVRTIGSRLFEYRISRTQRGVDDLQKQRDETIEKLKTATKYNSTQQLLEKYGGESPKQPSAPKSKSEKPQPVTPQQPHVARTGLPPPPTANIRRPSPQQPQQHQAGQEQRPSSSPYQSSIQQQPYPNSPPSPQPQQPQPQDQPGFAPNAFPGQQGPYIEQPHWYDRLLDVLLGEDEMQPRNRMAMICNACRLVNGQAPPGIKTPEELGRWRCGSCGSWNGVESETTKILSTLRESAAPEGTLAQASSEVPTQEEFADDDDVIDSRENQNTPSQDSDDFGEAQDTPDEDSRVEPVRRSKRKGVKK